MEKAPPACGVPPSSLFYRCRWRFATKVFRNARLAIINRVCLYLEDGASIQSVSGSTSLAISMGAVVASACCDQAVSFVA